jgi:hypothetical protein
MEARVLCRVVSVPACAHPFEALSRALSPSSAASSASLLDLGAVGNKKSAFRARLFARWQTDDHQSTAAASACALPHPLNERATWLRHNPASVYGDALVACAELDYDTQGNCASPCHTLCLLLALITSVRDARSITSPVDVGRVGCDGRT